MKMLLSKSIAPQLCTGLTPTIMILLYLQEQITCACISPEDFNFLSRVYKNTSKKYDKCF